VAAPALRAPQEPRRFAPRGTGAAGAPGWRARDRWRSVNGARSCQCPVV